jgi:uncharacterized RDD family membrane protein YckC
MSETAKGTIALEFAGFWRRSGAYIIDAIVLVAVFSYLKPFNLPGSDPLWQFSFMDNDRVWLTKFESLLSPDAIILSGVFFVALWVWRGQTLGMMVAGIKVIRTDGTALDTTHGIIRYFGYLISIIPLFLGFIWIAFDACKQGWHDKLADTYVVKLPPVAEVNHAAPPTAAA